MEVERSSLSHNENASGSEACNSYDRQLWRPLWVKVLQLKPYLTFSEHLRTAEYSVKNFSIVFNPHEKLKNGCIINTIQPMNNLWLRDIQ